MPKQKLAYVTAICPWTIDDCFALTSDLLTSVITSLIFELQEAYVLK